MVPNPPTPTIENLNLAPHMLKFNAVHRVFFLLKNIMPTFATSPFKNNRDNKIPFKKESPQNYLF